MGLIEVADFARITVMVRVQVPFRQDNILSVRNAFYGFQLRRKIFWDSICLTVASVIKTFLSQQYRDNAIQDKAHLIHGAQIDILVELGKSDAEVNDDRPDKESLPWLPADLLGMMENGWEVGWSLASHSRGSQHTIGNSRAQELSNDQFRLRIHPSRASVLCWGPIQVIQVLWDNQLQGLPC